MNRPNTKPLTTGLWLFGRILFFAACIGTVLAIIYTIENVRGKHAWNNCLRALEGRRASLDWTIYIPPQVPDDQNIFKAPKMAEWFVKTRKQIGWPVTPSGFPVSPLPRYGSTNQVLIADVEVILPRSPDVSDMNVPIWQFDLPETRTNAQKFLMDIIGPTAPGCQGSFLFAKNPLDQIKPAHIVLRATTSPTAANIRNLFPENRALPETSRLRIQSSGDNSFRVWLTPPTWISASNYLAQTEQSVANFDLIRDALKRPYARMDGDYQHPFDRPIPNFVMVRNVSQALAQRTECYLLMDQSESALRELTLLHDLSRLLIPESEAKRIVLVSAMIHVAISGLYAATVTEGLRLKGWNEPQLISIQRELKEVNLVPPLVHSFQTETAGVCRTLESCGTGELYSLFSSGSVHYTVWDRMKHPGYFLSQFIPRGWVYQNMATVACLNQKLIESIDLSKNLVRPSQVGARTREIETTLEHFSPYNVAARISTPNYFKASQTVARNQTLLNQALIACALERFHKANGKYPDNLDALIPGFAELLPHDVINGQPYHYRIGAGDNFVLYSVGWNEKDDGGVPGTSLSNGDWVWGSAKP